MNTDITASAAWTRHPDRRMSGGPLGKAGDLRAGLGGTASPHWPEARDAPQGRRLAQREPEA